MLDLATDHNFEYDPETIYKVLIVHSAKHKYKFINKAQTKHNIPINIDEDYTVPAKYNSVLFIDVDWEWLKDQENHKVLTSSIIEQYGTNGITVLETKS